MMEYKLYPNLPPEALGPCSVENPQVAYHLSVIRAKMQGLKIKSRHLSKNMRSALKY